MGRSGNPARAAWEPLRNVPQDEWNPAVFTTARAVGAEPPTEIWINRLYQVTVRKMEGLTHLSIHRHDRAAVRDWRHLQQIKNEVCGGEREAVELYPAESRLVDASNEYHLWVFPEGTRLPFGMADGLITSAAQTADFNRGLPNGQGKGRQRDWQPGLTTGGGGRADRT